LPCQFGTTYSLIQADPTLEGVLEAIRAGRVRVVSRPLRGTELFAVGVVLTGGEILGPASWLVRMIEEGFGVNAIGTHGEPVTFPTAERLRGLPQSLTQG
jgi:hypothetical protein